MSENPNTVFIKGREDDENLKENVRYAFRGWIGEKDYINENPKPEIITLSTKRVVYDFSLYPHYEIEDATKVATSIDYFDVQEMEFTFTLTKFIDNNGNTEDEIIRVKENVISLKPEYKNFLSGKVTLPSRDKNGKFITALGTFGATNVTQVYFLENSQYKVLG